MGSLANDLLSFYQFGGDYSAIRFIQNNPDSSAVAAFPNDISVHVESFVDGTYTLTGQRGGQRFEIHTAEIQGVTAINNILFYSCYDPEGRGFDLNISPTYPLGWEKPTPKEFHIRSEDSSGNSIFSTETNEMPQAFKYYLDLANQILAHYKFSMNRN